MQVTSFEIQGPLLIEPRVFTDDRGYFYESYNEAAFYAAGITEHFVQDNQSLSKKNVVRGLHFQSPPFAQGKLVRVMQGSVIDVAVDIRKSSPTYGKHVRVELNAASRKMFYIPPGFAHGFAALEDDTIFLYKCTNLYDKVSEGGIIWNDPDLNIDWGVEQPIISSKDLELPSFRQFETKF